MPGADRPVALRFDDAGLGSDVLVLVHGHPFDRSMWAPQLEPVVRAGWRVIVPDLRGYGESPIVPGLTAMSAFAADIRALLDGLGIGQCAIGGLSMGGQIAMEVCRSYPERVRALLLAATFPQPETEEGKRARSIMANRLVRDGMVEYAEEVLSRMVGPTTRATYPGVADYVLQMMRSAHPEGAAAALRGRAQRPDYIPTLATVDAPALVVVGDEDAFTTHEDAMRMHRLLRQSELVWLPGVGHMPNLERPAEFNEALLRLLCRVRARS